MLKRRGLSNSFDKSSFYVKSRDFGIYTKVSSVIIALLFLCIITVNLITGHSSTSTDQYFSGELYKPAVQAISVIFIFSLFIMLCRNVTSGQKWPKYFIFLVFYYVTLLISDLTSGNPTVSLTGLSTLVFILYFSITIDNSDGLAVNARNLLIVYLLMNLVSIFLVPGYAIEKNYQGAVSFRLHGLANHANTLGPYMVLTIIYLIIHPFSSKLFNTAVLFLAVILMLLTQSKTTLFLFVIVIIFASPWLLKKISRTFKISVALILGPPLVFMLLSFVFSGGFIEDSLNNPEITSISGRDVVWSTAIDAWLQNPLFGFGYTKLWNDEMVQNFYINYGWQPRYSHNQLVQTLGQAGILGSIGLTGFLGVLFWGASKVSEKSISIFLFGIVISFFFIRGISEVPIGNGFISDNTMIELLVIIAIFDPALRRKVYDAKR